MKACVLLRNKDRCVTTSGRVEKCYSTQEISTPGKKTSLKKHIFLWKESLGVNKLCLNVAARNEVGRLSLKLAKDTNILKFYIHLQALPDNDIARQCLQLSMDMPEKTQSQKPRATVGGANI